MVIKSVGGSVLKGGILTKTNIADMGGRYRFTVTFATPKMQINNRHLVADASENMKAPLNLHQRSAFATFAT